MLKLRHALFTLLLALGALPLQGCFFQSEGQPELAYLVAYSILDPRFETSTRLDITADIYNGMDQPMEVVQLKLISHAEKEYVLDYQTISKLNQVGRFNAFPLEKPIEDGRIAGTDGLSHLSPSGLNFLFVPSFRRAILTYKDDSGVHETEVQDLRTLMEQSRNETIEWMRKEHEERQKYLKDLKQAAQKRLASKDQE